MTNELLATNAANLKDANREVREQIERGVFDIETVKQANRTLIETLEESLGIADEAKRRRVAAEAELRNTLAAAQLTTRERAPQPQT